MYACCIDRPQIISTTASLNLFPMGETRTLSCEVGGIPAPTVSWLFESTPIGSNKTDTGSSVLLFEAKPEQEGTYTCTASNPLGTTSAQLQVQIQGNSIVFQQTRLCILSRCVSICRSSRRALISLHLYLV